MFASKDNAVFELLARIAVWKLRTLLGAQSKHKSHMHLPSGPLSLFGNA